MVRPLTILAAASLAVAAVAWQRSVDQLQQDGKTISTNLRLVDGTLMVPVKDVAAYLGGELKVQNGTATISTASRTQPGGAPYQAGIGLPGATLPGGSVLQGGLTSTLPNLVEPTRPVPKEIVVKTGQDAVAGGFALRLVGVEDLEKAAYRTQFDGRKRKISPPNREERLVVARMRIENTGDATRRPPVPSGTDVVLFDEQGVGTPALAFDARSLGTYDTYDLAPSGDLPTYIALDAPLLTPKGAFEFAAVFSLPKDRALKRLTVALPSVDANDAGANVTVGLEP